MLRTQGFLLALLLSFGAFQAVYAEPAKTNQPDSAICYRNDGGYWVAPQPGWVNDAQTAAKFGVCVMYLPEGADFDNASAVVYPQNAALPEKKQPKRTIEQALVADAINDFHDASGKVSAKKNNVVNSKQGLRFDVWLLNNGPRPNEYEAIAYHITRDGVFFLVLSARTQANRDAAMPAFLAMLDGVIPLQVEKK